MQQPQYEQVVACIKKPPLQRTSEEAGMLVPWLMKKSQLFNTLKTGELLNREAFGRRVKFYEFVGLQQLLSYLSTLDLGPC